MACFVATLLAMTQEVYFLFRLLTNSVVKTIIQPKTKPIAQIERPV
ncbi:hypothetical protein ACFP3I_04060 [Chryseobacterium arachidis]